MPSLRGAWVARLPQRRAHAEEVRLAAHQGVVRAPPHPCVAPYRESLYLSRDAWPIFEDDSL
jgi:hypothetical protein